MPKNWGKNKAKWSHLSEAELPRRYSDLLVKFHDGAVDRAGPNRRQDRRTDRSS